MLRAASALRPTTIAVLAVLAVLTNISNLLAQESPAAQPIGSHALITQPINEAQLTRLHGNTHPLARPAYDLGTAPASLPMERMLLVLKRGPEQESSLRKLLDDQQDKGSPNYHKWLTPEEFGRQFGPSDGDVQAVTGWLQSHGFQVTATKGRSVIEFSGSASQVREAFHTAIHKYVVNGEQHWANSNDPSIPSALTPAVAGVFTLHNFIKRPQAHLVPEPAAFTSQRGKKPQVSFPQSGGSPVNALGPQDYATIYNIQPTYNRGNSGQSIHIGVVGRSNLFNGIQDVNDFASLFGICCGDFGIILNGPDPGDLGGGEEAEATLDSTWSHAVAPGATVRLVVSASTNTTDGVDLSEVYIIENNFADIMTESFSTCELGATDSQIAGTSALAQQAAAQGITYFVSTGDNGAAGCDSPSSASAQFPVSVNLLASTPFTVAVGGTMFNEGSQTSTYWGTTAPLSETALSYIPENVWNESCSSSSCGANANLAAGSGGASAGNLANGGTTSGFTKPTWQAGVTGIPNDGVRDLPDVSLSAAGHDPYLVCIGGSCSQNFIFFISGTSASAPSFAGIMALVDQQVLLNNPSQSPRQGQANYVFYKLAATQNGSLGSCNGSSTTLPAATCIFNDTTVGNNAVPGELNYGLPSAQYQAGVGYDLATGLGSVNVDNLVTQWNSVTFRATTTTLGLNPVTNITHGTSVAVNVSVAPSSGTGTPSGDVSLLAAANLNPLASLNEVDGFTLNAGQVVSSTSQLPGGTYLVEAHYAGDSTFGASDSNQVTVTVSAENSTTTETASAFDQSGNSLSLTSVPFGSLVYVRADIAGASGKGVPSGQVTFADTAGSLPAVNPQVVPPIAVQNPSPLNSEGNTSIGNGIISFDEGPHSISASYAGDSSFSASSSSQAVTFTIQPGFAGVSGPTDVSISSPGLSGQTTVGIVASSHFSTAISFTCTGLPAEATCSTASATGQGPTNVVNTAITITTTAPHTTMLRSSGRTYYAVMMLGGLPLVGLLLFKTPKGRIGTISIGLLLLSLLVVLPACGGGGGGGGSHQDPGTPAGSYTVTVTATAGSISQRGSFTLTVK